MSNIDLNNNTETSAVVGNESLRFAFIVTLTNFKKIMSYDFCTRKTCSTSRKFQVFTEPKNQRGLVHICHIA